MTRKISSEREKICSNGYIPGGELWDIVKEGIKFPFDDAFQAEYPKEALEKLDKYKAGKELFRKTVVLMADAVLGKIPPTSKGIKIELIILPQLGDSSVENNERKLTEE